MTVTVERPPTVHRRTRKTFAERVADQFERGEMVTVTVDEHGPGWWVTAVDRAAQTFEVYQGKTMTVSWLEVSQ